MPNNTSPKPREMTVAKARKIMGVMAKNMTDSQLQTLIDLQYAVAEQGFDVYLKKISDQ